MVERFCDVKVFVSVGDFEELGDFGIVVFVVKVLEVDIFGLWCGD